MAYLHCPWLSGGQALARFLSPFLAPPPPTSLLWVWCGWSSRQLQSSRGGPSWRSLRVVGCTGEPWQGHVEGVGAGRWARSGGFGSHLGGRAVGLAKFCLQVGGASRWEQQGPCQVVGQCLSANVSEMGPGGQDRAVQKGDRALPLHCLVREKGPVEEIVSWGCQGYNSWADTLCKAGLAGEGNGGCGSAGGSWRPGIWAWPPEQ